MTTAYSPVAEILLPGEDLGTELADDAMHWAGIYQQLADFHAQLEERMLKEAGDGHQAGAHSMTLPEVTRRLLGLRQRAEYWTQRHWRLAGLQLDPTERVAIYGPMRQRLTRREFQLVDFLARHPNRYFPARRIAIEAWHNDDLREEQVRVYVSRLRAKLRALGVPCTIVAGRQQGYALVY